MFVGSAVPSAGAVYTVVALLNVAESLEYKASLQALPAGVPPDVFKLCPPCKISSLKLFVITNGKR